jgi:hypothetical protein
MHDIQADGRMTLQELRKLATAGVPRRALSANESPKGGTPVK